MKLSIKRIITAALCLTLSFAFVACSEEPAGEEAKGTKVSFCSNGQNVLREEEFSGGEFVVNTFRGDVEAGQIIVNPDRDVAKFNFKANDLTREGGSEKLTADLIDVFAEKYIEVKQSTSGNTPTGWYPDALVPMKNYAAKRDNKINKGENQGIWININIPKNAVPGTYKGTGELTLDDETISVPMTVNIYNIDMPEENHFKTAFWIDAQKIASGEGKSATEELIKKYYDFAASKRVSPMTLPEYNKVGVAYDAEDWVENSIRYARDNRIASYAFPFTGDGNGVVDQSYLEEILEELARRNVELKKQGEDIDLFRKGYFYFGNLIDEPSPSTYDKVRECDLRVHKAKLKIADSDILKDYPELQESVLKIHHVVTTHINTVLYGTDEVGGVQTWCPTIDHFSGKKARATAIERMNSTDRRGGEGVWWYTCCNPRNPFPTLHLDDRLMSPRTTSWMQYDYKIQGRIYWSMNAWERFVDNRVATSGYDLWRDALNYENCNGDGILLYPGSKYGVDGPLATLRLEAFREANEDYELLGVLENGIKALNAEMGKSYDAEKIMCKFYDRLYDGILLNADITASGFEQVRKEMLALTEKVMNDKAAAISLLDGYNK